MKLIKDKNRLGMIIFIIAEANFFLSLILAYAWFYGESSAIAEKNLELGKASINTVFLLSSSITFWFAEKNHDNGKQEKFRMWLLVTFLLGLIFLFGQGIEWKELIQKNITISSSMFGTTFFTLTGFHGLHVLIGIIIIAILLFLAWKGKFVNSGSSAVSTVSYYWHFVDAVWIVIFTLVYLGVHI